MPIVAAPPGRFTTTAVCVSRSLSVGASNRKSWSVELPVANGMTSCTGRDGNSCADAAPAQRIKSRDRAARMARMLSYNACDVQVPAPGKLRTLPRRCPRSGAAQLSDLSDLSNLSNLSNEADPDRRAVRGGWLHRHHDAHRRAWTFRAARTTG